MGPLLQADGLRRAYSSGDIETLALDGVDLSLQRGEFVAIVGASGSGKTTLLNCLSGLDTAYEGRIAFDDKALDTLSDADLSSLRHDRIGFVFQSFHLLDHLTALENVALPQYFGPTDGEPDDRAADLLGEVGLGDRLQAYPTGLSGGQKQRVAIARALFCDPDILFCDEPTGSLDQTTGLDIMRLFHRLNEERDLTLVVVTHEPHIAHLARRRIVLQDGAIIEDRQQTPRWPKPTDGDASPNAFDLTATTEVPT